MIAIQNEKTLDIRTMAPRERHPMVFRWFDGLKTGESFTLVNDHDPKPLYYQLNAERPEAFDWSYVEQGPEVWRVRIEKKSDAEGDKDGCCGCCGI